MKKEGAQNQGHQEDCLALLVEAVSCRSHLPSLPGAHVSAAGRTYPACLARMCVRMHAVCGVCGGASAGMGVCAWLGPCTLRGKRLAERP